MTRKDFIVVANILVRLINNRNIKKNTIDGACYELRTTNPNFDRDIFESYIEERLL